MALTDFRTTYAWRAALDLAPLLVRVAEQLPDDETSGLAAELRRLAIDMPAAIATQLSAGHDVALAVALRTVAALEVIERVYPALDTAAARSATDALCERVASNIGETVPAPPPAPAEEAEADAEPTPVEPVQIAPESVAAMPAPEASAPTTVPITSGDNVVHPDITQ